MREGQSEIIHEEIWGHNTYFDNHFVASSTVGISLCY